MDTKIFSIRRAVGVAAIIVAGQLSLSVASAQTFTQEVQQHSNGQGMVTIHHNDEIDRLVNAAPEKPKADKPKKEAPKAEKAKTEKPKAEKPKESKAEKPKAEKPKEEKPKAEKPKAEKPKAEKPKAEKPKAEKPKAEKPKAEKPKAEKPKTTSTPLLASVTAKPRQRQQEDTTHQQQPPQQDSTPPIVTLPELPADTAALPTGTRHGYKTTGYRVQAFAGGNTRRDRQRAEQTGNAMRQLFPGEDVYVRFYSPRWVCRVGNYRTYEEARDKMYMIRKMGYESATVVKGKIIVYSYE